MQALQERSPQNDALRRYDEIARILTGRADAVANDGVVWVQELCAALHVPSLAACGVTPKDLPGLVEKASVASSMQGNPIELIFDEMREILTRAL